MWTPKLNQLAYQCIEVSGLPGDQLALADPTNSPLDPRTREVEGQRETPLPEPVRPTRTSKPGGSTTKGRSSGFGKRLGSGSQTHRVEGFWRDQGRIGVRVAPKPGLQCRTATGRERADDPLHLECCDCTASRSAGNCQGGLTILPIMRKNRSIPPLSAALQRQVWA